MNEAIKIVVVDDGHDWAIYYAPSDWTDTETRAVGHKLRVSDKQARQLLDMFPNWAIVKPDSEYRR